jgi:hypothetical protein
VAVSGSYAYVVNPEPAGLRVVDVSTPSAPVEVGSFDTPGSASGVAVSGPYVYLADLRAGLWVMSSCSGLLFEDGFESGDLSAWSAVAP